MSLGSGLDYRLSIKKFSTFFQELGFRFTDFNIESSIMGFDSIMQDVDFLYDHAYKIAALEDSLALAMDKDSIYNP